MIIMRNMIKAKETNKETVENDLANSLNINTNNDNTNGFLNTQPEKKNQANVKKKELKSIRK